MKNEQLFAAMEDSNLDLIGMADVNRNWSTAHIDDTWRARTRSWWEASKSTIAYNIRDCTVSSFQPGGTILQSIDRIMHRVQASGTDPSGLGRWSWMRFCGRHDVTVMTICVYRPVDHPIVLALTLHSHST